MEFSVIVPAYNSIQFLHRCISSVRAQSVTDWELIVVDDGSTDGSAALLDAYAKEDPRIRVIHQKNNGQFFARRRGIDAAQGDYLVFLDSDDAWMPDCLQTLHAVIKNHAPDMILYTGRVIREGPGGAQMIGHVFEHEQWLTVSQMKEMLISGDELNSLWLKAFRRELFFGDDTDYSSLAGVHCGEDKVQLFTP